MSKTHEETAHQKRDANMIKCSPSLAMKKMQI